MRIIKLIILLGVPVAAQWLNLPTPGIPRTPDGKPNLAAPAPKTSGGKPDFSGMWIPRDILPCNPKDRGVQCTELPLTPQVVNFAAGIKDGLPYQPWAADLFKSRSKDAAYIDPHMRCMPPNFPRAWAGIVLASAFGIVFYGAVALAERLTTSWHPSSRGFRGE